MNSSRYVNLMSVRILLMFFHIDNVTLKQDQTSNRYDSILLWLQTENGLMTISHLLSYPQSRDAIASKNQNKQELINVTCNVSYALFNENHGITTNVPLE